MNNEEFDLTNLRRSLTTLQTAINDYRKFSNNNEIRQYIVDACVKRFEYTIETAWKMMKRYLKLAYGKQDVELTMNNIFRLMEGYGFVQSWERWRNYYQKRIDTSREYDDNKALELLPIIHNFVIDCEFLYQQLLHKVNKND